MYTLGEGGGNCHGGLGQYGLGSVRVPPLIPKAIKLNICGLDHSGSETFNYCQ